MRYVVDRIKNGIAVCEDDEKNMIDIPKYKLPSGVKEGDIIIEHKGFLKIDNNGTLAERERIKDKINKFFKKVDVKAYLFF